MIRECWDQFRHWLARDYIDSHRCETETWRRKATEAEIALTKIDPKGELRTLDSGRIEREVMRKFNNAKRVNSFCGQCDRETIHENGYCIGCGCQTILEE